MALVMSSLNFKKNKSCKFLIPKSFIHAAGGLVTRICVNGACFSRQLPIKELTTSNFSDGSSTEYTKLKGSWLKSEMNHSIFRLFSFRIYLKRGMILGILIFTII